MDNGYQEYVTEVPYTYDYFRELSPNLVRLSLLLSGLDVAPFKTCCELGFGLGLSMNVHSSAGIAEWWGTDFNKGQVIEARYLADKVRNNAQFDGDSFKEFAHRRDIPPMDFIALHGVWSWVSESNRHYILKFIKEKLKIGGVLYISYNCSPGTAAMHPVRDVMHHIIVNEASNKNYANKVQETVEFMEKVVNLSPAFGQNNPDGLARVKELKSKPISYLAHEYLNENWNSFNFDDIHRQLAGVGLEFGGSSNLFERLQKLNFTTEQRSFIDGISSVQSKELLKDFLSHKKFRKDLWVMGARRSHASLISKKLFSLNIVKSSIDSPKNISLNAPIGEIHLDNNVYCPIIRALDDFQVRSIGELYEAIKNEHITKEKYIEALQILLGMQHVSPANSITEVARVTESCQNFNAYVLDHAKYSDEIKVLASPVTGSGIHVSRIEMFIISEGLKTSSFSELVEAVKSLLTKSNMHLSKGGLKIDDPKLIHEKLTESIKFFIEEKLAMFEGLMLVEKGLFKIGPRASKNDSFNTCDI